MNDQPRRAPTWLPALGCLGVVAALFLACLMPLVLVDLMRTALENLHLSPTVATFAVVGIFLGGLINIPVYSIVRDEIQPYNPASAYGMWGWPPVLTRLRQETTVAINLGGCVIPSAIALWELWYLADVGGRPALVLAIVAVANVALCYFIARPIRGVGIAMPGLVPPLVTVGLTWLLLSGGDYASQRAPVAFVAGVAGPLIGADLLHLREFTRVSVGLLSIGGAGTFDGIVLSGMLAALLAG